MDTLELTIPRWRPPNQNAFVFEDYYDADEAAIIPQFIVGFGFKSPQEHFTYDYYIVGEEDEYDDSSKCLKRIKSWKVVFQSDFEDKALEENLMSLITKVCVHFKGKTEIKVFKDGSYNNVKIYEANIKDGIVTISKSF